MRGLRVLENIINRQRDPIGIILAQDDYSSCSLYRNLLHFRILDRKHARVLLKSLELLNVSKITYVL